MQSSDAGDEDSINFRPSPNFRHMKKYLKDKIGEPSYSPTYGVLDFPDTEIMKNRKVEHTAEVNPPLPNQPPLPPPEPLLANFKKEVVNDEYVDTSAMLLKIKTDPTETCGKSEKPEETMCRNFVRNTCDRGALCRYVHKIIPSQLKGVYKLCIDFENDVCRRPHCTYVHVTLHEKEHFFRTGYIPKHAFSHIKKDPNQTKPVKVPTPVPPPLNFSTAQPFPLGASPIPNYSGPPNMKMMPNPYAGIISPRQWTADTDTKDSPEITALYAGTSFTHSGRPMLTNSNIMQNQNAFAAQWPELERPLGVDMSAHFSRASAFPHHMGLFSSQPPPPPPPNMAHNPYAPIMSPKRQWTDMEKSSTTTSPPPEEYGGPSDAKKCRNCDVNELRLQHNKNKVKKMIETSEDLDMRVAQITKKNSKLNEILILLIDVVTENCVTGRPQNNVKKNYGNNAAQVMIDVMAAECADSDMSPEDPYRLND